MSDATSSFLDQLLAGYDAACGPLIRCPMLLAVSGGLDSMALLAGSQQLSASGVLGDLVVGHLNHGLRGSESERDRRFVEERSSAFSLRCVSATLGPDQIRRDAAGSVESAARKHRYQFLTNTALEHNCRFIVTAHHQHDQAETVLHHIIRGTGVRGVCGMPLLRPLTVRVDCARPMLQMTREIIDGYVSEQHIAYHTDHSNDDQRFLRNRIRHELLPRLRSHYNEQVVRHLCSLAEQAQESLQTLDMVAEEILERAILDRVTDLVRIDRGELKSVPDPMLRHTLTLLWKQQDWPRRNMTTEHWHRLSAVMRGEKATAMSLPGRINFEAEAQLVRLRRMTDRPKS